MNDPAASRFNQNYSTGTRLLHKGKVKQSLPYLEAAYDLDPGHVDAAVNLGGAYILSKRFREAVKVLEPMSVQASGNTMVWINLGAAYLGNPILADNEQQLKAIGAFHKAYQLNSQAPNVAYNIGLIHRDRQEISQAVKWFERALKSNPNDQDAQKIVSKLRTQLDMDDKDGAIS